MKVAEQAEIVEALKIKVAEKELLARKIENERKLERIIENHGKENKTIRAVVGDKIVTISRSATGNYPKAYDIQIHVSDLDIMVQV